MLLRCGVLGGCSGDGFRQLAEDASESAEVIGVEVVGVDDELRDLLGSRLQSFPGSGQRDLDRALIRASPPTLDQAAR
jgi:hypothetical protein